MRPSDPAFVTSPQSRFPIWRPHIAEGVYDVLMPDTGQGDGPSPLHPGQIVAQGAANTMDRPIIAAPPPARNCLPSGAHQTLQVGPGPQQWSRFNSGPYYAPPPPIFADSGDDNLQSSRTSVYHGLNTMDPRHRLAPQQSRPTVAGYRPRNER